MPTPVLEQLPQYRSHKVVRAAKILDRCIHFGDLEDVWTDTRLESDPNVPNKPTAGWGVLTEFGPVWPGRSWLANHDPQVGGYLVIYEDGYHSYSPAKAFEEGYTRIEEEAKPSQTVAASVCAPDLGLVDGLKVGEISSQWRCAVCGVMQRAGTVMVMVPDGVLKGDPAWSVSEQCRNNAHNGHWSGWCLACAPKASARA